jgi:hypothetical protein
LTSQTTLDFRRRLGLLPAAVQVQAKQSYRLWLSDPWHNSLRFKKVSQTGPAYSARVGSGHRAVGVRRGDLVVWFWIGTHAEYDNLLGQLR